MDVETSKACTASITSEVLKPVAQFFAANTYDVFGLLSLPYVLIHHGTMRELRLAMFTRALVQTQNVGKFERSESARREVEEETTRVVKSELEKDQRFHEETRRHLASLLQNEDVRSSVRALLLAAASATWTSFESVAADAWEVVLNSRPTYLAQNMFRHIDHGDPNEEVTQKQIGLGVLARYDFNVRDKLGSILRSKFAFTSVTAIRKAYSSAFGKPAGLETALARPELSVIEATRHLIVHRGGLVDEEYKHRTKSTLPVGTPLPLTGSTISCWTNAVIDSGCELLVFLDDWLLRNPDH